MNRNEAIEALDRLFIKCEEIDYWHSKGYDMYPDYMIVREYLRGFSDDEEDDLK